MRKGLMIFMAVCKYSTGYFIYAGYKYSPHPGMGHPTSIKGRPD
jgi:hypothetical protein